VVGAIGVVSSDPGDWQLLHALLTDCLTLGMTPEVQAALESNIGLLREQVRLKANDPHFRRSLGAALLARGDGKGAAAEFRLALGLMQKGPAECNEVAWTLATSSEANQRYGSIAVEFATRACELTEWKNATYLDTLAAAQAVPGQKALPGVGVTDACPSLFHGRYFSHSW
jgi:hypothetical protein